MASFAVSGFSRPVGVAAPARRPLRLTARPSQMRVKASPTTETDKSAVEKAIENAKETCEQGNVGACAAAWDEVEELAASASDKKLTKVAGDPLDEYCDENPEADECRIYED